jgi:glycosyltransferase involved in cell wall biosynthesis
MFPPIQSGSSHYAATIADGLSMRGHDVLVISSNTGKLNDGYDYDHIKLPTMLIPSTPISHGYRLPYCFYPISNPLVGSIIRKYKPDVIHANGHFLNTSWMSAGVASKLDIPLVLTVHTKLGHTNTVLNALMRYTERSLLRWIWRNVDSAIALDRQMRYYIKDSLYLDDPQIRSIPLAIDIDKLLHSGNPENDILEKITPNRVILSISHLTPLKSPRTLLHAFHRIASEVEDVDLVFVGKVHDLEPQQLASKLGLKSRVHFMGELPHRLIPSLLRQSIAEAHSLDSRTGFDNACIEAMVMGVPVISCVQSDNFDRPWLKNGENVLLVPPRSIDEVEGALRLITQNHSTRAKIGDNAREMAQSVFSVNRMLDDLESLYDELVN